MPSVLHQALVRLFENRPELAPELLRDVFHTDLPEYTEARTESADLSQVASPEYHADLVVLLVDGKPVFGIVIEVQLSPEARKKFTWPVYASVLRARFECDVMVLVVTPDPSVARWADQQIRVSSRHVMHPVVLGPDSVPVITDPARAEADPELGVLSVMAHGHGEVDQAVQIALAAGAGVSHISDRERAVLYYDLIQSALSEAARKALQMLPQGYEFQSETVKKSVEQGLAQGHIEARTVAVIAVLEARGLPVTEEQRAHIQECTDIETLDRWIRRAVTIATVDELFN